MKKGAVETYGKILRRYVLFQNELNKMSNPTMSKYRGRNDFDEINSFNTLRGLGRISLGQEKLTSFGYSPVDSDLAIAISTMVIMELFVDMYKILNLREKLDIINDIDANLLIKMRETKDFEKIVFLLLDEANGPIILQALNFSEISIYDKVLQMKALDSKDVSLLMELFPLFESEYNAYNIEVNEDFMAREIKKWPDIFDGNVEKAYEDAAAFLDQYSVINANLYDRIAEMTNLSNVDGTEAMLRKFMELR